MVEAIFTPAHPHALEALLNEPFAGTFNQATANRKSHRFQFIVLDVVPVLIEIIVELC